MNSLRLGAFRGTEDNDMTNHHRGVSVMRVERCIGEIDDAMARVRR